jgi:putative DNA methylase
MRCATGAMWSSRMLRPRIGDLYPLIPDPEHTSKKPTLQPHWFEEHGSDDVPPGYLIPMAYLWTRTVRCKNPTCGATVPLVRQTWLCKKAGRYLALNMIAAKGTRQVRFEPVEANSAAGLRFDPEGFSKGGNAKCPF